MRNNKMKGFTLVELLVVIAILAILATVSVVGYTSFIKSAHISNDENIAAQLNQFLAAYQADHTTEHYGKPITEDNIWEITQTILKDSQLDELEPHAKDYGYHYYFKFDRQGGGEYVAADENNLRISAFTRVVRFFVSADTPKSNYAGVFYDEAFNKYFLCDTKGSPIAEAIKGFHTFKDIDGTTSAEQFANFKTLVMDLNQELYGDLKKLAESGVFVTKEGNFAFDRNAEHSNLFFHEDATFVGNTIKDAENELLLGADKPLLKVTEATNIVIPNGIKLPANSLNIDAANDLVTITISANSWTNEIKDIVDAYFTNDNVIVVVGGSEYKINGNYIFNKEEYDSADLSNYVDILKFNNPLDTFDIIVVDNKDGKVDNASTNLSHVLWEKGASFFLTHDNAKGTKNDGSDVSILDLKWSIVEGGNYVELVDETTGEFKFKDTYDFDVVDATITLKAVATINKAGLNDNSAEYAWQEVTIKVAGLRSVDYKLVNQKWDNNDATLVYNSNESGSNLHVLEHIVVPANTTNNLVLNYTIDVTSADSSVVSKEDTSEATKDTIKTNKASAKATTLTIKVGDYKTYTIDVSIFDASNFAVIPKNTEIYIGNMNAIDISDLFATADGGEFPVGAELRVFQSKGDKDSYMNFDRGYMWDSETDEDGAVNACYVDKNIAKVVVDDEGNVSYETIQFTGTRGGQKLWFAVYHNGTRISEDVIAVDVVEAMNVKNYEQLATEAFKGKSLTFLNNVVMTQPENGYHQFNLGVGATLYGNFYTFDITSRDNKGGYGFIELGNNSTMRDLRVLGKIFEDVVLASSGLYGSAAVYAPQNATIDNCYIANCRSPLAVGNEDVTDPANIGTCIVRNTVLFGGRYCSVDLRNGTLQIEGKVVTVNQLHNDPNDDMADDVVGTGITVFILSTKETTKIVIPESTDEQKNELVQYNFISETDAEKLPDLPIPDHSLLDKDIALGYSLRDILKKMNMDPIPLSDKMQEMFGMEDTVTTSWKKCTKCNVVHEVGTEKSDCCSKDHSHRYSCKLEAATTKQVPHYEKFMFTDANGVIYVNPSMLATGITESGFNISGLDKNIYKYVTTTFRAFSFMSIFNYDLDICAVINNTDNQMLFKESKIAVSKYCPWDAVDVVLDADGNVVAGATQNYVAYDFIGGSIIH